MFGKDKYNQLLNDYQLLEKEYRELYMTAEAAKSQLAYIQELIEKYDIIDTVENKVNEKYFVCLSGSEADITIELVEVNKPVGYRKDRPHLYARVSHRLTKDLEWMNEKECKIDKVEAVDENVGNGSLLLEALYKLMKKFDSGFITAIYGELSFVDQEDFDKLEYFYGKHGFEVTFNEERTSGSIKKLL